MALQTSNKRLVVLAEALVRNRSDLDAVLNGVVAQRAELWTEEVVDSLHLVLVELLRNVRV